VCEESLSRPAIVNFFEIMHKEINQYKLKVEAAAAFLKTKFDQLPAIGLVLGTGLGGIVKQMEITVSIPYGDIPNFPRATVESHAGQLISGHLNGRTIVALQGRFHYYEGYSTREVTFPIRVLALLGVKTLVVSNAAGGLNPSFSPGTLMVIHDHLNLIPENPLRGPNIDAWGPRFPDLSQAYDRQLIDTTLACARRLSMNKVTTGTYVAIPGPSLETPAETRFLRQCGADAVGMSTVPEVIVARHAGLRVLGISVVSNVNDPDNLKPIILEEIISQTRAVEDSFQRLVGEVVKEIEIPRSAI